MPHAKDESSTEPILDALRPIKLSPPTSAAASPPRPSSPRLPRLARVEESGTALTSHPITRLPALGSDIKELRILDFDTECRPQHYSEWRDESQITAIAWGWVDEEKVEYEILNQDLSNQAEMLARFLEAYDEADVLTGHYIARHDLPLITDHCMRLGWPLPEPKLVQDTKALPKVKGLGLSQENLATLYKLDESKHHMNGRLWAVANDLSPEGRESARVRVVSDVIQHRKLREALLERGYLGAPKVWRAK